MAGRRGRPIRSATGERCDRRRELRLTESEDRDLESVSSEVGLPVAEILRDAVNEYVADFRERKVFKRISSGSKSAHT